MNTLAIVISAVLTLAASFPYVMEVISKKTKPRVVSWFTWAAIGAIGASASFSQHQTAAGAYAAACSLACVVVVILGLRDGEKTLYKLDAICLCGALVGLFSLLIFHNPTVTIALTVATDFVGAIPTFKHAWEKPHEETVLSYGMYATGGLVALFAANFDTLTGFAYPLYVLFSDGTTTCLLLASPHRHAHPAVTTPQAPRVKSAGTRRAFVSWAQQTRLFCLYEPRAIRVLQSHDLPPFLNPWLDELREETSLASKQLGRILASMHAGEPLEPSLICRGYAAYLLMSSQEGFLDGLVALHSSTNAHINVCRAILPLLPVDSGAHKWVATRIKTLTSISTALRKTVAYYVGDAATPATRHLRTTAREVARFEEGLWQESFSRPLSGSDPASQALRAPAGGTAKSASA